MVFRTYDIAGLGGAAGEEEDVWTAGAVVELVDACVGSGPRRVIEVELMGLGLLTLDERRGCHGRSQEGDSSTRELHGHECVPCEDKNWLGL